MFMNTAKLKRLVKKNTKLILILTIILVFVAIFLYTIITIESLSKQVVVPTQVKLIPYVSGNIFSYNLLFYNQATSMIPYFLINYKMRNISTLYVNASLYKDPVPKKIFILNTTNECLFCYNDTAIENYLARDLVSYGILNNTSHIYIININNVEEIPNNSILIVLNGLLPSYFFNTTDNQSNNTVLNKLFLKGTNILYIGKSFSNVLLPSGFVIPNKNVPYYLTSNTTKYNSTLKKSLLKEPLKNFFFDNATFKFANMSYSAYSATNANYKYNSADYGFLSYINIYNGSLVVFSNNPNSWPANEVSSDLAKAISEMFWIPKYAEGSIQINSTGNIKNLSIKNFGIMLNVTNLSYNASIPYYSVNNLKSLNSSTARIILYSESNYSINNNTIYSYIEYRPKYTINGSLSLPPFIIQEQSIPISMTVFINSSAPSLIVPYISIYNVNSTRISEQPLSYVRAPQGKNFTFLQTQSFSIPSGSYIFSLKSLNGFTYASAFLNIPNPNISLVYSDFANNSYRFYLTIHGIPLSNINYTISLNGENPSKGVINNGTIIYSLPQGAPELYGNLNFSIATLSRNFVYTASNKPISITVSGKYIEIGIITVIMIILMTVIKGPNKDEFYIDIPAMPSQNLTNITLKPANIVSTFDKLNIYYHWKYMPLSEEEVKTAIANNIRYGGMPVFLTYHNIESLLNQLVDSKYLLLEDNLYAPKEWIEKSGHDIVYLATFKKLRVWFISHAYMFTEIDTSEYADIIVTIKGSKNYIIIYSDTTKFKNVPIYKNGQTYLAFLNYDLMYEFKEKLYSMEGEDIEKLKFYINSEKIKLLDADTPESTLA